MLPRIPHFYRNVGVFGVVRTVLVLTVVLAAGVSLPLRDSGYWPVAVGAAAGLLAPYLALDALVERVEVVMRFHRYAGIGILLGVVLLRQPIENASPIPLAGALAFLALYIGAYFWLLSDPRIETRDRRT